MDLTPKQTELLQKIQSTIHSLSSQKNHAETLNKVVPLATNILGADRCSFFIYDPTHERLWLQSGSGMIERELDIPIRGSVSGEVARSGISRIVNNLSGLNGTHSDVEALTGYKTRNILCVPIFGTSTQKIRGIFQVINKHDEQPFSPQDQRLAEEIAVAVQPVVSKLYHEQSLYTTRSLLLSRHPWREHLRTWSFPITGGILLAIVALLLLI